MLKLYLKRPFKIILKVHGALFLGVLCSLAFLQEDPWLKARLERSIKQSIEEVIGVPFSCSLSHVDMLGGIITAKMHAASPDGAWTFSSPEAVIRFSWLSWLKQAGFEVRLIFQKAAVFSRYENKQWAIVDPFIKLIRAPVTLPIRLVSCGFSQGTVHLERDAFRLAMRASSSSDILKDVVATRMFVQEGTMQRAGASLAEHITGTITVDVPTENVDNYAVKMRVNADLPFVQNAPKRSLLIYTYKDMVGSWQWYPEDRSLMIKAEGISFNADDTISMEAEVIGLVEKAALYLPFIPLLKNMRGDVAGRAHVHILDGAVEYEGSGRVQDLSYGTMRLGPTALKIKGSKQKVSGEVDFEDFQGVAPSGSWEYDLITEKCESIWHLSKNCARIPKIVIMKEGARAALTYKDGLLTGSYTLKALIDASIAGKGNKARKALIKGRIESDAREMRLHGTLDGAPFMIRMGFDPYELTHFSYKSVGKNVQGILLEKKNGSLEGTIPFEYIKDALVHFFGFQPQGSAHVAVKASMQSNPFSIDVLMSDGTIKIPEAHNFIKEAQASVSYDHARRCLTVKNATLQLQKGSISSGCSTLLFSEIGALSYAHLPCRAHNAFISWNKDFFGMLSGALTGVYSTGKKGGRWTCTGALTLDKAHLRSNLLSSQVQQDLLRSSSDLAKNIELDLHFSTKSPLQVKTFFFNTNTEINASVKGTVAHPLVTGIIELNKGSFLFPYKPLYVSMGKLYLTADQPDDPVIQLTAKNTIKKYAITMHVSGTVHQPKILFESSPALPEEQIITLLLSGSEDGPLYLAMPNIVMMHLESLLFGSSEHSSKAQQFFTTLLKPLKNVRFVPTWSGQQGKGLQGTIEVDFTDRLRAKAQNNLKLSEETKFEVEYALSDDMTVKAIRDDAGSLGGEVEMRWKF